MKLSKTILTLSLAAALLAMAASLAGLFWQGGGQPYSFTTLRGQTVEIYGQGLYRYDTTVIAIGFRIGDGFALLVGIPSLLAALWLARRGSLRAGLALAGALAYLFYQYGSSALGSAYNEVLTLYILVMATSMIGLFASVRAIDPETLRRCYTPAAPRRGTGIFLMITGALIFLIWFLLSMLPALLAGNTPVEVASYTTVITFVVDMGILAPALFTTGLLLLRRDPFGDLLAPIVLVFLDILGLGLIFMGTGQMLLGLMSIGQFIGFVVSFAILTIVSMAFTLRLYRGILPG